MAPSTLPSFYRGMAREALDGECPLRRLRRKLQAKQASPQVLPEQDLKQPHGGAACPLPSPPGQGIMPRCPRRIPHPYTWLGNPPLVLHSLGQQPKDFASPQGDFPHSRWGFLPSGVFLVPTMLGKEGGPQQRPQLPPNTCILTLAMMIAGIPTVPVPGIREEDMIHAAQCFMAESLEPTGQEGEGMQRRRKRRWAAMEQPLGESCKRDKPRKRAAHRNLLPLFLAHLEK